MLEDRFYEPDTKCIADTLEEAYENYVENFEGEEGEEPLSYKAWEETVIWNY